MTGSGSVVRLEDEQPAEGVDDQRTIMQHGGADMGVALHGGTMDVLEPEGAPLHPFEF